jgi:hypothetical protein
MTSMTQRAERMAPGHLYNPETGTGIAWTPAEVQLWVGGQVAATAAHTTADPWTFWYELAFAAAFPAVTHWWFGSAWTGKVWVRPIGAPARGASRVLTGGIRFVDRAEPEFTWQVTLDDAQEPWPTADGTPAAVPVLVGVPLPPWAVQPLNLPLRAALARVVLGLGDGTIPAALAPADEASIRAVLAGVDLTGRPPAAQAAVLAELGLTLDQSAAVLARGPAPDWAATVLEVLAPAQWVTSLVAAADLPAAFPTTAGAWRLEQIDHPLREAFCRLQGLTLPVADEGAGAAGAGH